MSSGELGLRKEVVQILRCYDAQPVENVVRVGVPDVECTRGWIELKKTREWPTSGVVKLDHDLSKEQKIWLRRRRKLGGACWVLLQIDQDFLLLDGVDAAQFIGVATRPQLESVARTCRGLRELRDCLPRWIA